MKTPLVAISAFLLFGIHGVAQVPTNARPFQLSIDSASIANLLPSPPAAGSNAEKQDLALMHKIETQRTPDQVKQAKWDDTHEDFFVYASIIGSHFTPEALPLTATLSARLRKTAGGIDNPLKETFRRIRPYNYDHSLHPVCETNMEFSYPSGHSINGYIYAYVLSELFPDKRDLLLARADEYAHDRIICGVHYPEDVEASRRVASFITGSLLSNDDFKAALNDSRKEIHQVLPGDSKNTAR